MTKTKNIEIVPSDYDDLYEDIIDSLDNDQSFYKLPRKKNIVGPKSELIKKLLSYPLKDFNISEYSTYKENVWVLNKGNNFTPSKCHFTSTMRGSNDLKKMITYHFIPTFHPFGTIKSFATAASHSRHYSYIEEYVLKKYELNATPNNIKSLSAQMLNRSLDAARDIGKPSVYNSLFQYIKFWIYLSEQKFIPDGYCLNVPMRSVDTKERVIDIRNHSIENYIGFKPFTEDELETLIEYALFWTEKAIPVMQKIKTFLIKKGRDKSATNIAKQFKYDEFEKVLGEKVDGQTICGYSVTNHINYGKKHLLKSTGRIKVYPKKIWLYTWVRSYAAA